MLNVPYEDRKFAQWGGARWDGELKKWVYVGETLPERLQPYRSVPHSPERWVEDDINGRTESLAPRGRVSLREHQSRAAEAISAAHSDGRVGFLLADDVGLGKTYSTIEALHQMGSKLNVLVLAPLSVVPHWRRSLESYGTGGHRWCVLNYDRAKSLLDTPDEAVNAVRTRTKNKRIATKGQSKVAWDVVICDEAHRLKNPNSQRSAAVRSLIKAHGTDAFVLWMSATAGQNPLELAYLAPLLAEQTGSKVRDLNDFESWCKQLGLSVKKGSFGQWGWDRNERDLELMRSLLFENGEAGLRRRPQDLAGWPEMVRSLTPVELTNSERSLYEQAWEEFCEVLLLAKKGQDSQNAMVAALRFRQKSSYLRTSHTVRFAEDLLENGMQVAISTQFLESARAIADALPGSVVISGKENAAQREDARLMFQRGQSKVAVFTITEGISLHAGEQAVEATSAERALLIHDLRWSALDMAQIEGRCHRDGEKAVAYYLYGESTVEEGVAAAVLQKLSDMASMLGDDMLALDELLRLGGW
jgi:SNF2 family DNA or RNA helicase